MPASAPAVALPDPWLLAALAGAALAPPLLVALLLVGAWLLPTAALGVPRAVRALAPPLLAAGMAWWLVLPRLEPGAGTVALDRAIDALAQLHGAWTGGAPLTDTAPLVAYARAVWTPALVAGGVLAVVAVPWLLYAGHGTATRSESYKSGAGSAVGAPGAPAAERLPAPGAFRLKGRTTRALLRQRTQAPRHFLGHLLVEGWVTLLVAGGGVGKTDWFLAFVAASLRARAAQRRGEPLPRFCGLEVLPARWYVLSEQTAETLLPYLRRWGLDAADAAAGVVWVTWDDACRRWTKQGYDGFPTFAHVAPAAERDARRQGCDGILWDTYMQWAADTSGNVNDTGGVRRCFARFKAAAAGGGWWLWRRRRLSIAVNLHTNKAGQVAGNESIKASCDALYVLEAPDPQNERGQGHVRVLTCHKSRDRESPRKLVVATDPETGAYDLYQAPARSSTRQPSTPSTPTVPPPGTAVDTATGDGLLAALRGAGAAGGTLSECAASGGVSRQAAHKRLTGLERRGTVERCGRRDGADLWRLKGAAA